VSTPTGTAPTTGPSRSWIRDLAVSATVVVTLGSAIFSAGMLFAKVEALEKDLEDTKAALAKQREAFEFFRCELLHQKFDSGTLTCTGVPLPPLPQQTP